MKKIITTLLCCLAFTYVQAQTVPQGMQYQAVARDQKGEVLADQSVSLKISLITNVAKGQTVYYSETHDIVTNQYGLFTLVIGNGTVQKGSFAEVPWSTEDIWMQVSIKQKGSAGFTTISNSKLLAVPYAFHAATASQLVDKKGKNTGSDVTAPMAADGSRSAGIPAQTWSLFGNLKTDPTKDALGTTDFADLVVITNNIERLRILADGNIVIKNSLTIEKDLLVKGTTTLEKALTVNSSLSVTDNNESFVTTITNTNTGNGDGLKIKLGGVHPLWNGQAYESIGVDDLDPVAKTFQPQIDLVKGWIQSSNVSINQSDILSLLKSNGTFLAGALCQMTNALSPTLNQKLGLPLDLATPINNSLGLPYNLSAPINSGLSLPLVMPAITTPAVVLPALEVDLGALGDFDIIGETTLLPSQTLFPKSTLLPALPNLTIPAIPTQYLTIPAIPQIDCSGLPQIVMPDIKTTNVTGSLTSNNEFVKFVDKDDRTLGVIRALSIGNFRDRLVSNEYLFHLVSVVGGIDIAKGLLNLASEFNKVRQQYNKLGVEYVSGNGDYAEWMQRINVEEEITPGDIVGVKSGKISKDLRGAEQIMAVSTQPIMNGNMPEGNTALQGNSIAFMGQIPVKIIGKVATGDFIVAKGNVSGYGVAVKPSEMTTEDFRLVVGRAWETKEVEGPKMVNTLVGVQNNDFLKIIERYQQKVVTMEQQLEENNQRLKAIEKALNLSSAKQSAKKK